MIDKNNDFTCLLDARSGSGMTSARGEQGRSMVEMLGVLAVIGVLSVGSIAGYRYAMDNYYTNEILAGASQRAVLVAAQIASGREPSLKEFSKMNDTAGAVFSDEVADDIENAFGIKVSGVKGSVCENLIKATEETDVYIANDDATLSEVTCQDEGNEFLFVYSHDMGDLDTSCYGVECPDGSTCSHGQCQCSNGLFVCGTQCCAEGTYCAQDSADTSQNICATPTGDCTKNSDCGEGMYCKFSGGDCAGPTGGTCTAKGTLSPHTLALPAGDLTVYIGDIMNWWSAQNLCAVHGKQMVTIADFGAQVPAGKETCYFDYGRADEKGKSDQKCICSGGDTDCSLTNEVLSARKVFTFSWIAGSIFPSNTCLGRTVRSDGFFGGSPRNSGMDVMCR